MSAPKKGGRTFRPATSPEEKENQLITLAYDLVEKQIKAGTASAQVLTHFLKMASTREALEQKRLERDILLLSAKVEAINSTKKLEDLFEKAIEAMRLYSGRGSDGHDTS